MSSINSSFAVSLYGLTVSSSEENNNFFVVSTSNSLGVVDKILVNSFMRASSSADQSKPEKKKRELILR